MTKSLRHACADAGTNYLICDDATLAGFNPGDVASSLAYLDKLTKETVKLLDGCNTIEDCRAFANGRRGQVYNWLKALGYTEHANTILAAMTAAKARATA